MERAHIAACLLFAIMPALGDGMPLDLQSFFDTDAVLETGGIGEGLALDTEGRRLDAGSLPPTFVDGAVTATQDGLARFRFAPLKQASLDALMIDGQVLPVDAGLVESIDLALLSAPGAFPNPFTSLEFRYTDGSVETRRLGPVPGWFNSPTAFDHTVYRYTDESQVQLLLRFATDFGSDEAAHLVQERGNGNAGGWRFVDGTGYVLYRLGELQGINQATLGVTVGNNFVISIATEYWDPAISTTDGYTVLANSMELYGGFEHRALGNLKQYEFDVTPFLAAGTGELYILLTDATPANGWGPFLQAISLFTGSARTFEETLEPPVDVSGATVHAMFATGSEAEKPYLYDNSGSGPSNRGHRFADASQSITYRFDLPDEVTSARLTMDLANNFVVSLGGSSDLIRYHSVSAATADERLYLVDEGNSIAGGDFRFADGTAYMIYQFDLPDDVTTAFAVVHVGNQFVIEVAAGPEGEFQVEKDWVAETGQETTDISNLTDYPIDLTKYLTNNPAKVVRLRLSDGVPSNGWGPYLKRIVIANRPDISGTTFETVLNSQDLYGEDIHTEYNKGYYTVDLAPFLVNNPRKEIFVRFTDGSTSDGWGPGIFWMAVYTGQINIWSDGLVFRDLRTTLGDPVNYGACLLHRRYLANAGKTLSAIALPSQPANEANRVYLLAATLNTAETPPRLTASRIPGGKVRITWPAAASGYRLQGATSLTPPANWTDVLGTPSKVGEEFALEIQASLATQFLRLIK